MLTRTIGKNTSFPSSKNLIGYRSKLQRGFALNRGVIALDIDRTLTDRAHKIPDKVITYLHSVQKMGFTFIFVTGREFVYAMDALATVPFPFYLGTQNGADLFKMPEKKHVLSRYFSQKVVQNIETIFEKVEEDFLLYAGYEKGDFCYFRPNRYSMETKKYLKLMQQRSAKPWKAVESFSISSQSSFPFIKAIGQKKTFLDLEPIILKENSVELVIIQDPRREGSHYMLISDVLATKDQAIQYFQEKENLQGPLIAGGDDLNDLRMLEMADVAISMVDADPHVKNKAQILCPSSTDYGMIQGLEEAISRC